jgi:hypothetical protein
MSEMTNRLFVGIKISKSLQNELDSPMPGVKQYYDGTNNNYLQIVNLRNEKIIGRYLDDGFPAANLNDVSRNICSLVKLITRGRRIEEDEVHIYSC